MDNKALEMMLVDLASRLRNYQGRKVYGYLKPEEKTLVNSIIDEIGKGPAVKEAYDLWYEKQEELSRFYRTNLPQRVALSANPEFKVLKNTVIKAASEIDFPEEKELDEKVLGEAIKDPNREEDHAREDHTHEKPSPDVMTVGLAVTRLFNNVTRIFGNKFKDNPAQTPKVDRKLRRKVIEKEQAHGIKH